MHIPPGYEDNFGKDRVCRLEEALCGLKESPQAWFGKFTKTMKLLRYKQCNGDHTLFFQHFPSGVVTILIVYVDDIIITRSDTVEAKKLKDHLTQHF